MNAIQTAKERRETWNRYHLPGGTNLHRIKKNAAFFSAANKKDDYVHEYCKAAVCITLKQLGRDFITEAVGNQCKLRHDVVCLDSGNIYEIETEHTRANRFLHNPDSNCFPIIVILVEGLSLEEAIRKTEQTVRDNE